MRYKISKFKKNCKYNPLKKGGLNKKRHISMLKVKLYLFSLFLKFCFGRSGAFLCNLWSC